MAPMIGFKELRKLVKRKPVFVKCGSFHVRVTFSALRDLALHDDLSQLRFQVTSSEADDCVKVQDIWLYSPSINSSKFAVYDPTKFKA